MSNVLNYIDRYGNETFEEKSFNDVENIIFSAIAYVDFDGILENNRYHKISLKECADIFFKRYSKKELNKNVLATQIGIKIFRRIKDKKRYQNLMLYNYAYKRSNCEQFSALFIDINSKLTYVAYEGTDELISGWHENFEMSYHYPVPAQYDAIRYLNRHISPFSRREYIIGGHSKGGNLALVAAMHANPLIRKKIIKVISNDGPGLKDDLVDTKAYKRILPIYDLIVPNYTVVGLLMRHKEDCHVILSNKNGIMAHSLLSWQIVEDHFVNANLSKYSRNIDTVITKWLDTYNLEERKEFVTEFFAIFDRAGIDDLIDIKDSTLPSIIKIIRETRHLKPETKEMMMNFVHFFVDFIKRDALSFIDSLNKKTEKKS